MEKNISLLRLFLKKIASHQTPIRKEEKRDAATIRTYNIKYTILCEYLHLKNQSKLKAGKVTKEWCYEYYDALCEKYTNNYSIRCVQLVVSVLEYGKNEKIISDNPVPAIKLIKTPPKDPEYFTPDEIKLWFEFQTSDEDLQKAGHLAVVQICTGYDYGDFKEIRREHVAIFRGRKYIKKPRHKNDNECIAPLPYECECILEFYNYNMDLLSNSEYNAYLKIISKRLGTKPTLKCKDLRKVFVMDQLNNKGVPVAAVSKMAGHKRIKTTEDTYAQVNINLIGNELDKLGL